MNENEGLNIQESTKCSIAIPVYQQPLHSIRESINGIDYKLIETKEELIQCYNLYKNSFMKDEPIARNFKVDDLQGEDELKFLDNKDFYEPIKDGVSLIAVDPESRNKVVGMNISQISKRNESDLEGTNLSKYSFFTWFLFYCLDLVGSPQDILKLSPDMNTIYYILLLGVEESYRGKGIAGNLVDKGLELAKLENCDGTFVHASSDVSRNIFQKKGFNTLKEVLWDTIVYEGVNVCVGKDFGSDKISSHLYKD